MKTLVQSTSVIRKIKNTGLLLMTLFVLYLVCMLGSTWSIVWGLQRVHSAHQVLNLSTQTLDSISNSMDVLKGVLTNPRPQVLSSVVWTHLKRSQELLAQISRQFPDREQMQPLVQVAGDKLKSLGQISNEIFGQLKTADRRKRMANLKSEIRVASQYQLDAADAIRKIQTFAKKESDRSIEQVYWQRNIPIYAVLFIGLLFCFAFWLLGSQLIRAFNPMMAQLYAHEKESQARALAEKERLEFLVESSISLNRSLQYEETLHQVALSAVPYLAEWAVLDVLEDGDRIRRVKTACTHEKMQPFFSIIEKSGPPSLSSKSIISEVLSVGKTYVVPEFSQCGEFSFVNSMRSSPQIDSHDTETLDSLGHYSGMIIPIKVRGKTIGALTLMSASKSRPRGGRMGEKDRLIAEDYVSRAASAIENASLYRESQEALKTRDEFLMIASHELRTPLTPLKLQFQSIERVLKNHLSESESQFEALNREKMKRMIEVSNRMIKRFSTLIEDLLDVSRIHAGKFMLRTESFDFVKLLKEVTDRFASELARNRCTLSIIAPEKLEGQWDASRMEQVLVNLLSNSMRYGAGKPIEVKLEQFDFEVVLSVKDQGIGISEKDQSRIFQRFERASPSSHYGGLGLGLFITAQILELHGGSIRVISEPGMGSVFLAKFPLSLLQENVAVRASGLNSRVSTSQTAASQEQGVFL